MRYLIVSIVLMTIISCTAIKLPVPEPFSKQATRMPVKGLNGWMINQKLSFGNYQTSPVKRGWDFSAAVQYPDFRINAEKAMLKVFNIGVDNKSVRQRGKFQYTIKNGNLAAAVYATEKFDEKQLVYKSNNPFIGGASKTRQYEYAFTAGIVPLHAQHAAPWSLVLINAYDIRNNSGQKLTDPPYVEEEGYATNGEKSIAIRPLRVEQVATAKGNTKVFGGKLLAGYELSINNNAICLVDILDNTIWLNNGMDAEEQLISASIASAILLKRMQDVEKDKADL